ncbi:MAG: hypothetical protein RBU37_08250 [Myxococcota bacterium]|jgi:hypothetical protein|nr:hypothetical protein [Myxococcota bacterium]
MPRLICVLSLIVFFAFGCTDNTKPSSELEALSELFGGEDNGYGVWRADAWAFVP